MKSKSVMVTGGSRGLGLAICEAFLREGYDVATCARGERELANTAKKFRDKFPRRKVVTLPCDISLENQFSVSGGNTDFNFAAFYEHAIASLWPIDVLICNAAIYGPMGPSETVDLDAWRRTIEVNLIGTLNMCRTVIPYFKKQGRGKIIIISGGGATSPMPNISAYAASKAAVVRLMETLAEELRPYNIDVNAIAPGMLATRMVQQVIDAGPDVVGKKFYEKNVECMAGAGTPLSRAAKLAVYLSSEKANGITGKLISAQWDKWETLHEHREELSTSDVYCLRRILPRDRDKEW